MRKWYTCAPRDFVGNEIFFNRDVGLMCRGFRSLGIESRSVIVGEPREDDWPEALRASWEEICSSEWWNAQEVEGVALLSWASPRYAEVVRAIAGSSAKLVHFTDTNGLFSPLSGFREYLSAQRSYLWDRHTIVRWVLAWGSLPHSLVFKMRRRELPRACMLVEGDAFGAASPQAVERYKTLVRRVVGGDGSSKIRLLPFPVSFHFGGEIVTDRKDEVLAVGRWDSHQKRSPLLMKSIEKVAARRKTTVFRLFGRAGEGLERWHAELPDRIRRQVILEGIVPNEEVAAAFNRARVLLVSSAYEGCHVSSAEAVCAGMTVVSCRSSTLAAVEWHTTRESGGLAERETAEDLGDALELELRQWDEGKRDPLRIAKGWREVFMPDRVALQVLKIAGGKAEPEIRNQGGDCLS